MIIASGTFYIINPFNKGNIFFFAIATWRINPCDKTQPVVAAFDGKNEASQVHLSMWLDVFCACKSDASAFRSDNVTAVKWMKIRSPL